MIAHVYGLLLWMGFLILLHWLIPLAPVRFWGRVPFSWRVFIELNLATFLLFGFDKLSAQLRRQRISEYVLYLATLLGGSIGTLLAMNLLRHKTRKTSFQIVVALLILLQIAIVISTR